jgi:hypothetical protein
MKGVLPSGLIHWLIVPVVQQIFVLPWLLFSELSTKN